MRIVKALILSVPVAALPVAGVSTALVLSAFSNSAIAANAADKEKQVSAKVGKPLQEALKLANSGNLKEAMAKAEEAAAVPSRSAYDTYKANEVIAYIAVKDHDYARAAQAYEATLDSGELPADQKVARIDQLTKIYYQLHNYPKAVQYGKEYLKNGGNDLLIAVLVAQSYFQQKDNNNAIAATEDLIRMAKASGQPVKEEWLQLLMNCQIRANKETDALKTLDQLLVLYPSRQYWSQMLNYTQTHGPSTDRKNLELYRLKLYTGVLKAQEYVEMAQLSIALGFPGDAKTVLAKGFADKLLGVDDKKDRQERLLKLAEANSASDKASLPEFAKEAAASAKGDDDIKLGEAYASYGEYDKAIEAIKRGLKKGNVKAADEAQLQLGVAYIGAKRYKDAAAAFKSVPSDSKLASTARLWEIYAGNQS